MGGLKFAAFEGDPLNQISRESSFISLIVVLCETHLGALKQLEEARMALK